MFYIYTIYAWMHRQYTHMHIYTRIYICVVYVYMYMCN